MNFLRSFFSDSPPQSPPPSPTPHPDPDPTPHSPTSSGWNLTSLIDSYSRDLADFSSAFRQDTSLISRSLLPVPLSIDHAQHSLESVGQAIDDLGSLLLSLSPLDHDPSSSSAPSSPVAVAPGIVVSGDKYSRHAAQLSAIRGDASTYLDEPDDGAEFANWKLGFVLDDRDEEIQRLLSGDGVVRSIYDTVVPREVQRDVFWERYFYRVYKLDKAEDARARLVQRAMTGEDDEDDLRWDFEEEEDIGGGKIGGGNEVNLGIDDGRPLTSDALESDCGKSGEKEAKAMEKDSGGDSSSKDSDLSIISSQPSMPEVEDLGWDEIEDASVDNEKAKVKPAEGVSRTRKDEVRNRLSSATEDDELSWDIEDEYGSHHP